MSKENKVYFFHDGDYRGWWFAAENFRTAKSMALVSARVTTDFMDNPFVDIRGRLERKHYIDGEYDEKGEIIKIKDEGELTTQQVVDLGLAWWNCMECGDDVFEISDNERLATCIDCGNEMEVPYK